MTKRSFQAMRFSAWCAMAAISVSCDSTTDSALSPPPPSSSSSSMTTQSVMVESTDGVKFRVDAKYTSRVAGEAVADLLGHVVVAPVPDELVESRVVRSAEPSIELASCSPLVAVTLSPLQEGVELIRYAWTWPTSFAPTETIGVLRLTSGTDECSGDVEEAQTVGVLSRGAQSEQQSALKLKMKWWGFNVDLSHAEACVLHYTATPAAWVGAVSLPAPYNGFVAAAVVLKAAWIYNNIGTDGVRLQFNWSGTMHDVDRRGASLDGLNRCIDTGGTVCVGGDACCDTLPDDSARARCKCDVRTGDMNSCG